MFGQTLLPPSAEWSHEWDHNDPNLNQLTTHSPPKSNEGNSEIPRLSNKFGTECLDILQLKMNSLHFENDVEEEKIKDVCFAVTHGGWSFTFRNDMKWL